jgi:Flp pilus assembly pilin Flp
MKIKQSTRAAAGVEYAALLGLIGVVAIGTATLVGAQAADIIRNNASAVASTVLPTPADPATEDAASVSDFPAVDAVTGRYYRTFAIVYFPEPVTYGASILPADEGYLPGIHDPAYMPAVPDDPARGPIMGGVAATFGPGVPPNAANLCALNDVYNFYPALYGLQDSDIEVTILSETRDTTTLPETHTIVALPDYPGTSVPVGDMASLGSHEMVKSFTCSRPSVAGDDPMRGQAL